MVPRMRGAGGLGDAWTDQGRRFDAAQFAGPYCVTCWIVTGLEPLQVVPERRLCGGDPIGHHIGGDVDLVVQPEQRLQHQAARPAVHEQMLEDDGQRPPLGVVLQQGEPHQRRSVRGKRPATFVLQDRVAPEPGGICLPIPRPGHLHLGLDDLEGGFTVHMESGPQVRVAVQQCRDRGMEPVRIDCAGEVDDEL